MIDRLEQLRIIPRMLMITMLIMTYQVVGWFMDLPDPSVAQSGLVSVCMGALTGCFGIWMGKESKTTVTASKVTHEQTYKGTPDSR